MARACFPTLYNESQAGDKAAVKAKHKEILADAAATGSRCGQCGYGLRVWTDVCWLGIARGQVS